MAAKTLQAVGLLTWLLAGACVTVSGGDPDQSVRTYVFEPDVRSVEGRSGARAGVLLVAPPSASPGYDTRLMVYTEEPAQLSYYAFSQWADAPARMLEPLLIDSLHRGGHFDAVVDIGAGVLADLRLDTELVALRQEVQNGTTSRVRLVVRAQLVQLRTRSVLATRTIEVAEAAPTNDARGGVIATNAALGEVLRQLTDFAAQAAASRPPP